MATLPITTAPSQPISQQHPVRILIVEDKEGLREKYSIYIDNLIKELLLQNRKIPYRTVTADCAAKAREELQKVSQVQVFDLMILDIEIPENRGGSPDEGKGIKVGLDAMETGSVMNIVVISGQLDHISYAKMKRLKLRDEEILQKGSLEGPSEEEFVKKHLRRAINHRLRETGAPELPGTITPVRNDRWGEKCAEALTERLKALVPYAERSIVYAFGLCFSKCLRDVGRSGDAIRSDALGRLGLEFEQDTDDFLVQQLLEMNHSLKEGRQEWSKLQTSLRLDFLAEPKPVTIGEIIDNVEKKFEPFKKGKDAKLFTSGVDRVKHASVTSYNDEVEAVLSEMIFGAVADCQDSQKQVVLNLSGEVDEAEGEWVKIRLEDNLRGTLSSDDIRAINAGIGVYSGKRCSRTWGLFVMQHVALHGGGRLTVQTSAGGNTMVYRIPQARNA